MAVSRGSNNPGAMTPDGGQQRRCDWRVPKLCNCHEIKRGQPGSNDGNEIFYQSFAAVTTLKRLGSYFYWLIFDIIDNAILEILGVL